MPSEMLTIVKEELLLFSPIMLFLRKICTSAQVV